MATRFELPSPAQAGRSRERQRAMSARTGRWASGRAAPRPGITRLAVGNQALGLHPINEAQRARVRINARYAARGLALRYIA